MIKPRFDAEIWLNDREEESRKALRDPKIRFNLRIVEQKPPPVLLPARIGDVLYGPDGKPMEV